MHENNEEKQPLPCVVLTVTGLSPSLEDPYPRFCPQSNRLRPLSTKSPSFQPFLSGKITVSVTYVPVGEITLPQHQP